jgi:hypothetical protein
MNIGATLTQEIQQGKGAIESNGDHTRHGTVMPAG